MITLKREQATLVDLWLNNVLGTHDGQEDNRTQSAEAYGYQVLCTHCLPSASSRHSPSFPEGEAAGQVVGKRVPELGLAPGLTDSRPLLPCHLPVHGFREENQRKTCKLVKDLWWKVTERRWC